MSEWYVSWNQSSVRRRASTSIALPRSMGCSRLKSGLFAYLKFRSMIFANSCASRARLQLRTTRDSVQDDSASEPAAVTSLSNSSTARSCAGKTRSEQSLIFTECASPTLVTFQSSPSTRDGLDHAAESTTAWKLWSDSETIGDVGNVNAGPSSSCAAVGRFAGSRSRHARTVLRKCCENAGGTD